MTTAATARRAMTTSTHRSSTRMRTARDGSRPTTPRHRRETVLYKVVPGDTLPAVARQFGMETEDVQRLNRWMMAAS